MKKKKWIFLLLFLNAGSLFVYAQKPNVIDFHSMKLVGIDHVPTDKGDGYHKTRFLFAKNRNNQIEITTFGGSNFRNIAVLGSERACVCVGDRISFSLIQFNLDSVRSRMLGLQDPNHFIYRYGRVTGGSENYFEFFDQDSIRIGKAPRIANESNILVIFESRLYLLSIQGKLKSYNIHNQVDSCGTCQEVRKQL